MVVSKYDTRSGHAFLATAAHPYSREEPAMPITTVHRTQIDHVSILDENGKFDANLGKALIPDEDLVKLYEHMVICRKLDEIAFKLQRSGRMGTFPQNMGQEAPSLGAAYALESNDWMVTCYRENCGLFWRGMPMEKILQHWMGDERGNDIPREIHATPIAVPIGTQMLHATGLAWAAKYRGDDQIACTFFGDGATSEGDFHEAMNFAANLDIGVVFFCQNNQWAISVPGHIQCSAETVAQRGVAYGMDCLRCDGNDIFAVVYCMNKAIESARKNNRPTFIEAVTYRLGDHTTADDARRYRDNEEVELWKTRDPITRIRTFLTAKKLWSDELQTALDERAETEVTAAVERAESIETPAISDIFNYTFAELPEPIIAQRDGMRTSSLGLDPSQIENTIHSS